MITLTRQASALIAATALAGGLSFAATQPAAAAPAGPAPAAAAHSFAFTPLTSDLKEGATGDEVRELQVRVSGYASDQLDQAFVATDGEFGPGTKAALQRFQKANGLEADGVVGKATRDKLNALAKDDGSTKNFAWDEFDSPDCGCFSGGPASEDTVKQNVRKQMFKLEAVRQKLGNVPITITSGYRTPNQNSADGGVSNSLHLHGAATDVISDKPIYEVRDAGRSSGFSGIITYPSQSFNHLDSTGEYRVEGNSPQYLFEK